MASTRDKNTARALMRDNPDLNYTAALRQVQATHDIASRVVELDEAHDATHPSEEADDPVPEVIREDFIGVASMLPGGALSDRHNVGEIVDISRSSDGMFDPWKIAGDITGDVTDRKALAETVMAWFGESPKRGTTPTHEVGEADVEVGARVAREIQSSGKAVGDVAAGIGTTPDDLTRALEGVRRFTLSELSDLIEVLDLDADPHYFVHGVSSPNYVTAKQRAMRELRQIPDDVDQWYPAMVLSGGPGKPSDADRVRALLRENDEVVILDQHDSDGAAPQVARHDPDSPDGFRLEPVQEWEPGA